MEEMDVIIPLIRQASSSQTRMGQATSPFLLSPAARTAKNNVD